MLFDFQPLKKDGSVSRLIISVKLEAVPICHAMCDPFDPSMLFVIRRAVRDAFLLEGK